MSGTGEINFGMLLRFGSICYMTKLSTRVEGRWGNSFDGAHTNWHPFPRVVSFPYPWCIPAIGIPRNLEVVGCVSYPLEKRQSQCRCPSILYMLRNHLKLQSYETGTQWHLPVIASNDNTLFQRMICLKIT